MVLKIIGMGFIMGKKSYLRDWWNLMDFIIVTTAYLPIIFSSNSGFNLNSLRSLRVLRPLRTISTVKELKMILTALISAIGLLLNSLVIIMFFFIVFAIGGLQLFSGFL